MRNTLFTVFAALIITACGSKEEKKEPAGFEVKRAKKEVRDNTRAEVPVDMNNKGIGPIKELVFPETVDTELAAQGEAKFNAICTACHLTDQRMIGPAMEGIYDRRSPEWVMNMMLNPDEMLRDDPIAKALLIEYNNSIMLNQNLTEEEARAIAEYLRTL